MSQGRRRRMSQLKQRANSSFFYLFVLFRPSVDWKKPTHFGEGHLHSVHQFKCYSRLETPAQKHPEIMFYQLSGHPLDLSS